MEVPTHHLKASLADHQRIRKKTTRFSGARLFLVAPVFLALVFVVSCSPEQEVELLVPLHVFDLPEGLALSAPLPKDVRIALAGKPAAIEKLKKAGLRYDLDLSNVKIGVQTIPIEESGFHIPKGLRFLRVDPTVVSVTADREVTKNAPVSLTIFGKPADGFLIADSSVKPPEVTLKGPEAALSAIQTVLTKPVEINGITESFKKEVALDLPENIRLEAPEGLIRCDIVVQEKFTIKNFKQIPVNGIGTDRCFSITPPTVDMEISGPLKVLESLLQTESFNVFVDLKELKPGVYVRRATISLPVKTALLGVQPELFTVAVRACEPE